MKPKFWCLLSGVALGVVQLTACSSDFSACTESRSCASGGAAGTVAGGDGGNSDAGASADESGGRAGKVGAGEAGDSAEAGAGGSKPMEELVPALFGPCAVKGAVVCEGHGAPERLACDGVSWQAGTTCASGKLCDSETGKCVNVVGECADATPGAVVCRQDVPLTCGPDLVTASEATECAGRCSDGVCQAPSCGDGKSQKGEECEAQPNDPPGACVDCKSGVCGDGVVYVGKEQCDDHNALSGDGCSATCKFEPISLASGGATTCARGANGAVKCWGSNAHGVLGLGTSSEQQLTPSSAVPLGRAAKSVSVGEGSACAVLENGDLKCWGDNTNGQLGTGNTNPVGTGPGQLEALESVFSGALRAATVSVGNGHTCAILQNGDLTCWGANGSGQLGQDSVAASLSPEVVALGASAKTDQVAAADQFNCALLTDQTVKCWGHSLFYELGEPSSNLGGGVGYATSLGDFSGEMATLLPLPFVPGHHATSISSGSRSSCAVLDDGTVSCWGQNTYGEAGTGTTQHVASVDGLPLPIVDLGERKVKSISLGSFHACALFEGGTVGCWGRNSSGQLGIGQPGIGPMAAIGDEPNEMGAFLKAVPLGRPAKQIATGVAHSCALLEDGTVVCWGLNDRGQLGTGDTDNRGDIGGLDVVKDKLKAVDLSF